MSTTIPQPARGPRGEPYCVRVNGKEEWHWTEEGAYEARDAALQAGSTSVRLIGLPCIGLVAGVPDEPLARIGGTP
jgi:hypothetical protein